MSNYEKCTSFWDQVFEKQEITVPAKQESGNSGFDYGMKWLCEGTETVLDYGCGSGSVLFLCANYGTTNHIGVDLSGVAIQKAQQRSEKMGRGNFDFVQGDVNYFKNIESESIDGIVLSNIIDNMYPADTKEVLAECERVLKRQGKVFVKLNPFLTQEQIVEYDIQVIQDNVLDDGLILWNNTTEQWAELLNCYFDVEEQKDLYYEEHQQYNRLFLLRKKKKSY